MVLLRLLRRMRGLLLLLSPRTAPASSTSVRHAPPLRSLLSALVHMGLELLVLLISMHGVAGLLRVHHRRLPLRGIHVCRHPHAASHRCSYP